MFDGIEQDIQRFKKDKIRDWWKNQMIISITHARSYEMIHWRNEAWISCVVQYMQYQNTKNGQKTYMNVVFNGLYAQQRLYDTQLREFYSHLPVPEEIVGLKTTILPESELFFENYFLLKKYEKEKP